MKLKRRQVLLTLAASATGLFSIPAARAEGYPGRPVRIVVGFPQGGPVDIAARMIASWLTERLNQPFIVENKPGAAGNVATDAVLRAAPDGYTLLMCGPVNTINTSLYDKLSFDFTSDITPVAGIYRVPLVFVVNPSVGARSVPEFVQYAKSRPATLNMASAGNGTPQHVAGELFKSMAGVDMLHVPYRGSAPALTDLLGGQVQVMFDAMPSAIEHIKSGRLRALAVTTATRSGILPDTPTISEFVPDYEVSSWYGLAAPNRISPDIVARLNAEVNAALTNAAFRGRLAAVGGVPIGGSSSDFGRLIAGETDKWRKVIRSANIKPD